LGSENYDWNWTATWIAGMYVYDMLYSVMYLYCVIQRGVWVYPSRNLELELLKLNNSNNEQEEVNFGFIRIYGPSLVLSISIFTNLQY
jgi:hypothetical protein